MAVPTVYRWDDIHAPQITTRSWTQIKNWFNKIFVTGYLEDDGVTMKPPMGWQVTVDDTNYYIDLQMIGDPQTEKLATIRYDFHRMRQGNTFNYLGAKITMWGHLYTQTISNNSGYFHPTIGVNDDELKVSPWVMIGTSRLYYNFSGCNTSVDAPAIPTLFNNINNYHAFHFMGNIVNDGVDLDGSKCIGTTGRSSRNIISLSNLSTEQSFRLTFPTYGINIGKTYTGATVTNRQTGVPEESATASLAYLGNPVNGLRYPYLDGGLYIKPMKVFDSTDGVYLGKLSGLYYSVQIKPLYQFPNNLIEFDGDGIYSGHKFIGITTITHGEFYINTTEDWAE